MQELLSISSSVTLDLERAVQLLGFQVPDVNAVV